MAALLAMPAGRENSLIVIGFQLLAELFGMVFYRWCLLRHLIRQPVTE